MRVIALLIAVTFASVSGAQTPAPPAPSAAPAGNAENGKKIYTSYGCYQCHNFAAHGGGAGPRLAPPPIPLSAFIRYVRKPTGEMPPYTEKVVSDEELADIRAFLLTIPAPPTAASIPILKP